MSCIKDKTGRFLSKDKFTLYVAMDDPTEKPRIRLQGNAKEVLSDYYDAVHKLSEAQTNFMRSTQVLEPKLDDKAVFLDIIKEMQLPAVQVSLRTVEEIELMEPRHTEN